MVIVLFALAFALVGGGFYSIYWGLPLIVMERGWTWVIAGSMFASSGFIIFALALIVRALHRLPDYLEAAHPDVVPEIEAAAVAPRTAFRPAPPEMPAHAPKAPPVPPLTPGSDIVTEGGAKWAVEEASEPAPAAPAGRDAPIAAPAITAPPPRPPLPIEPRPALPDEKEKTSRIGTLFGRVRDRAPAPVPPKPVESPKPLEPLKPLEPPKLPEPAEASPDVPIRAERPEPRAPEMVEETAEPAEPVAAEATPPTVVGTYTAGSTLYVMYSDGSIEAETATGVLRFASLDALKEHVSRGELS